MDLYELAQDYLSNPSGAVQTLLATFLNREATGVIHAGPHDPMRRYNSPDRGAAWRRVGGEPGTR